MQEQKQDLQKKKIKVTAHLPTDTGHKKVNDVQIYYELYGSSTAPVMFLHHGWRSSSNAWWKLVPHLCTKYRVIVIDLRGCNNSSKPEQEEDYTLAKYAQDVTALLQVFGVKSCTFIGHSLGGLVGMYLAINHPEFIDRLILVAPSFAKGLKLDPQNEAAMLAQYLHVNAGTEDRLVKQSKETTPRPEAYTDDGVRYAVQLSMRCNSAHVLGSWQALKNANLDLTKIKQPTLLCGASNDMLLMGEIAEYKRLPNATLHVFSRTGHSIAREVPQELAAVIEDFMTNGILKLPLGYAMPNQEGSEVS
mmetsp:Transcript_15195/g.16896  ORF Transcript_15195/g.16896 Transcript_15195/m.16896 type:complete len:305 (-) Transcript_15195:55-969(-)